MWLAASFGALLLLTVLRVLEKDFVTGSKINPFRLHWLSHSVGIPFIAVVIALNAETINSLSASFWVTLLAVVLGYYPAVSYLYLQTIRANDLSTILPLLSTIPVFTTLFGWILLGQEPSILGLLGVLLISFSIYVLHVHPKMSWKDPLIAISHSKPARAMALVGAITAIAAIGDKYAIDQSTVFIYTALNMLGAIAVLLISDYIMNRYHPAAASVRLKNIKGKSASRIALLGILLLACQVISFTALSLGPVTGYVVAIKNLNIVLASLLAIWLFREKLTRYKTYSYALSAIGLVLITL